MNIFRNFGDFFDLCFLSEILLKNGRNLTQISLKKHKPKKSPKIRKMFISNFSLLDLTPLVVKLTHQLFHILGVKAGFHPFPVHRVVLYKLLFECRRRFGCRHKTDEAHGCQDGYFHHGET